MTNLEPIEESDLNLKGKFVGSDAGSLENGSKSEKPSFESGEIKNPEIVLEKPIEAKEHNIEKEKTYSKILSKMQSNQATVPPSSTNEVKEDAAEAALAETAEAKIDKLVKLAMVKGVVHAVKVAKSMEDNYTLDEFHDKLMADEFHKALVEKRLIREL